MEEILAVAEMDPSTKKAAQNEALSVEGLVMEAAMDSVGIASTPDEQEELNIRLAKLIKLSEGEGIDGEDLGWNGPFMAVRYAIAKVVPQVMTYQEAVLEETAVQFKNINELNQDFAAMQGHFGAAADVKDEEAVGLVDGEAYFDKAAGILEEDPRYVIEGGIGETIVENLEEITTGDYPDGSVVAAHNCKSNDWSCGNWYEEYWSSYPYTFHGWTFKCATSNVVCQSKREQHTGAVCESAKARAMEYSCAGHSGSSSAVYDRPEALFNGLRGVKQYIDADGDLQTRDVNQEGVDGASGDSAAYLMDSQFGPYANQLNDCNSIISMSLNGVAKETTAEFRFKIDEYGQYLSLSAQLYDTGAKNVQVHQKN